MSDRTLYADIRRLLISYGCTEAEADRGAETFCNPPPPKPPDDRPPPCRAPDGGYWQ